MGAAAQIQRSRRRQCDRSHTGGAVERSYNRRTHWWTLGEVALGSLFIDIMFVPEPLRGVGIGTSLLQQAEQEAMRRVGEDHCGMSDSASLRHKKAVISDLSA